MILAAALAVGYIAVGRRATSRGAVAVWLLGCGVLAVAFASPLDAHAHTSFTAHMTQHLLVILVAAPLLALGRPVSRWLTPLVRSHRRPAGAALVVGATLALLGVLYLTHIPAFYDTALRHQPLHLVEHGLYLYAALGFWIVILEVDPLPRRAGHGQRIAALLVVPPAMGLLAAAIGTSDHVLYPAQDATLADQRAGAALMWIGPMIVILPAALALLLDWARDEERREQRIPVAARLTRRPSRPGDRVTAPES